MRSTAALTLLSVLVAACGGESADVATTPTAQVVGHVLAGPTCPVVTPGDRTCAPAPVEGVVELAQGDRVVATAPTDATGRFAVTLPEGTYRLAMDVGGRPLPRCEGREVTIRADTVTVADVTCDTGIR